MATTPQCTTGAQVRIVTINRPGLSWQQIPVHSDSSVARAAQMVGSQSMTGVVVDGTFYALCYTKHLDGRPELSEQLDAVVAELTPAPAPPACAHTFTTIRIAPLLDHLCNAVDAAREKAAGDRRWLNAIDAAWDWLLQQEAVRYDQAAHALRVASASESGTVYEANGDCQCTAFARNNACWHRAAARLVRRALEGQSLADVAALRGEIYDTLIEQGADWTEAQDAMDAASALLPALHTFAAEWDADVAAQRAALRARIGAAQAATMTRAA